MAMLMSLVTQIINWINTLFKKFLGDGGSDYSQYFMIGFMLLAAAKIFKIKLNVGGGK